MAQVEVLLPKMGESVAEATIIKWLKNEGDRIEADEPIIEIATDKVDSEVPAPAAGILLKKSCKEGDVVQVGQIIAVIGDENNNQTTTQPIANNPNTETIKVSTNGNGTTIAAKTELISTADFPKNGGSSRFYSPLVKSIAKTEGISFEELETITGTGLGGRVTKKDILAYLPHKGKTQTTPIQQIHTEKTPVSQESKPAVTHKPTVWIGANDEIIEMDRMRKLIAEHMVMSKQTSPHVTSYVEVDVTNMVLWREKNKKTFEAKHKEKITFTPLIIEAIVKAIKDFPMINISVDGDKIIKRKEINIGMATALPSGNLIVPVIKNADRLNLLGLTQAVNDLANRARNNQLKPEEIQGGTYTLTNVGTFGNVMGTPIINQPQVAIMAAGAIRKKPAVIETPLGDTIGIRHLMFLSHAYDHRVVDGALGGSFVRKVADYLEQFDLNREV
jgi:2-oxoglutarate dehydrogenase E2 component (dihydrolipoamide succinyltransferase)